MTGFVPDAATIAVALVGAAFLGFMVGVLLVAIASVGGSR